ncbi:MAG: ATP-binding cassette domain-containing protein [Planctomycetes bacterium]|nr:ATP-binding cassette domain-containing protein [Planctomycetota bacterium]
MQLGLRNSKEKQKSKEAKQEDNLGASETVGPGTHDRILGIEHLDKVIDIDQSPIGRTPRSNPATYIKMFDEIRDLYARLPDSKVRGYKPGRFSFNVSSDEGGGRCESCEGNGSNRMEMEMLADVWITCAVCGGKRFNHETLQILFKGKSIADVLELDVQQALEHFANVPSAEKMLRTLHDVGLDYIKLGQSSTTLSGGEAQRIKLARELVKRSTGRTLYILDEPTTGLHFADIKRLLIVLHGFVDAGNTVLVIEHNLDVIKTADWVIDLGPEGGDAGGEIVVAGTPEDIAECERSYTGMALHEVLREIQSSKFKVRKEATRQQGKKATKHREVVSIDNRQSTVVNSSVCVVGANQHNLKNISVEFPRNKTTICAGPSGSGKSSFAVDTVYAEGQRRYVESLSSYARQFLGRLQPPKVEHIHGLSPAICIEQKNTSRSPRSTVGTVTEIFDYMRVLWARIGEPFCPKCKVPIEALSSEEIVERIIAAKEGERAFILAPVAPTDGESHGDLLNRERANGYTRARVDGVVRELSEPIELGRGKDHRVELVVDRVIVRRAQRSRLADSVEQALAVGRGVIMVASADDKGEDGSHGLSLNRKVKDAACNDDLRLSQHRLCHQCGQELEELSPHCFSFNTRMGWCPTCEGLGTQQGASPSAIVVHPTRSLVDGAIAGWAKLDPDSSLFALLGAFAAHLGFDLNTSWNRLSDAQQAAVLQGCGEEWIETRFPISDFRFPIEECNPGAKSETESDRSLTVAARKEQSAIGNRKSGIPCQSRIRFRWRGFFPAIARAARANPKLRERLTGLTAEIPCEACQGSRLRVDAAAVRVNELTLNDICRRSLGEALNWFRSLELDARRRKIAGEILHEITSRLGFLVDVGLDYLSLNRASATLSGGEAQRIQLASQIGTGLTGVLYVLDEPTIGLHPRDNHRLIRALKHLRDLGNTLLLVEHDREVIDAADHVLDFGPGAGRFGGTVTADGSPEVLRKKKASLTGAYLSGSEAIPVPSNRRGVDAVYRNVKTSRHQDVKTQRTRSRKGTTPIDNRQSTIDNLNWLVIKGARANNLKEIDAAFPLGRFTCVTGVSGSGKSTLINNVLYNALAVRLHRASVTVGGHEKIIGLEQIDKVINVDQSPIGNTPTSNAATYTGAFDAIRELYAKLPLSKVRGYTVNRFSFNRPGGRCEACQGMGQRCIEMHFLPDVWIECESCNGARYVAETLDVAYRGKSIADVLNLSVAEAAQLFENVPAIRRMLKTLEDVGLGYLALGQAATTLSGGEAQRVKLASELGKPSTGKTLYILDEPTTGLHVDDLRKLLDVLHRLVDLGNTVICIEHNLDVIKTADWIIDLGPEAGDMGGEIVIAGTPESVAGYDNSHTGVALRKVLASGPIAERVVHRAGEELKSERAAPAIEAGAEAKMPWEENGREWHTQRRTDSNGKPIGWEADVLSWLVDSIELLGSFLPTDWNHRTRIEITADRSGPWFCHILTGFKDLLEVSIRVPQSTFGQYALQKSLGIKTLDERGDLPIYGQWSRVQIRRLSGIAGGWDNVRISLRDFKDVNRVAFHTFLKAAAIAYFKHCKRVDEKPELSEPWAVDGERWHLSQKSMSARQTPQWTPPLLMTIIGQFKKLQKNLMLDWNAKTAVAMKVPGEAASAGKIVTNMGRGLRLEIRAPQNSVTPTMIDRLGKDTEIRHCGNSAWVIFWVSSVGQMDSGQLRELWRLGRAGNEKF